MQTSEILHFTLVFYKKYLFIVKYKKRIDEQWLNKNCCFKTQEIE